jgi:hypothetical protein
VRRRALACIAALAAVAFASPAAAQDGPQQPTGWDGTNPFRCTLQFAGFGPTGPDPAVDPYCVEFDKRRQNVTAGGVVEFLSLEPARVAAATDKCFYFQSDHWRGSVVQEDGSTKTYEWDGHYFFDKARGEGGAWVTNFNFNGQTEDPSRIPGIPQEWARYFGPGTGGVITRNSVEADPACAERAQREPEKIYAAGAAGSPVPAPGSTPADPASCAGRVTRRSIGPVSLGETEAAVRERLGVPDLVRRGWLHYCRGALRVGFRGDRSGDSGSNPSAKVVALVGRAHGRVGKRVPRRAKRFARGIRRLRPGVLAGVRAKRVRYVAVVDRVDVKRRRGVVGFLRRAMGKA